MRGLLHGAAAALLAVFVLISCGDGSGLHAGAGAAKAGEPALTRPAAALDAALFCTPFSHPQRPAVLLVHGGFAAGFEPQDWTYLPLLHARGHDVCLLADPDRGLGDLQDAAEAVVHALRQMHARTGRGVAVVAQGQGGMVARWAIRFWPSARDAVSDLILLETPAQGSAAVAGGELLPLMAAVGLVPASAWQLAPDAQFIAALNAGDQTPGAIDYTSIYGDDNPLVQPPQTAALDAGQGNPAVTNVDLSALCPGRGAGPLANGDRAVVELVLDALAHAGPAQVARAGGEGLCTLLPFAPEELAAPQLEALRLRLAEAAHALAQPLFAPQEPALRPYAADPG